MKMITKINGATCLMNIEDTIVGIYAEELDKIIRSTNFTDLGITELIIDFGQVSMIDSIGLEAIKHAQEKGLNVSILNPRGLVKDMMARAVLTKQLTPLVKIAEKGRRISARKEIPIAVSC